MVSQSYYILTPKGEAYCKSLRGWDSSKKRQGLRSYLLSKARAGELTTRRLVDTSKLGGFSYSFILAWKKQIKELLGEGYIVLQTDTEMRLDKITRKLGSED